MLGFLSWRSGARGRAGWDGRLTSSSRAPATSRAEIAYRPPASEPVDSLTQPMMDGLRKPPNRPMLLISAMPPAASPFRYATESPRIPCRKPT